tara:strand:+ start:3309 stop:6059 length:2751 start_codon:yes stop_codon:yes gene_type:complete
MKKVLLFLFVMLPNILAAQETGTIVGNIKNVTTNEPISDAQVFVNNGSTGALSDLNGRFIITRVPVGTVTITAQMIGYATKTITDIAVSGDQVVTFDITLTPSAIELEELVITASQERGSQTFVLNERRTSEALVDGIGSVDIASVPVSDAAGVAQRMTGVTISEGRYVFIRGLGDRYSQTSLNGSALPSPEPEREVVPLDLFPANFLESLQTQKSYTPDLPADFSGGAVQIRTKDFPNRFTVTAGMGTSFNSNSQFREGWITYPIGGMNFLGFDDGSRNEPQSVIDIMGPLTTGNRLPADDATRLRVGQELRNSEQKFGPSLQNTPLNRSFSLGAGGRNDIFENGEIGYFITGQHSDTHTLQSNEIERKWRVSAFNPSITSDDRQPNVDYNFVRGTRTISWGTVGNFTFKPNTTQKISFKSTVNVNSDDEARTYNGENREDIGALVRSERSRFISRMMLWGQLSGEHQLFADSRLEWRVAGARASRNEPMLRESIYISESENEPYTLFPDAGSGAYFWSDLTDDDVSGALDWKLPLTDNSSVKVGGIYRQRTRDFASRRLLWDFLENTIVDFDESLSQGTVVESVRRHGQFSIGDIVEPGNLYDVTDERTGGYVMFDVQSFNRLQTVVGARIETYDLTLNSRGNNLQNIDKVDIVPSLNMNYSINDRMKVRTAVSRTLDRPEFRELAPFQFTEAASLRQIFGNPELTPSKIINTDLRFDFFPSPTELISIGGFYKTLDEPIEQVFIAAASSAYSFQNADKATILGIEFDTKFNIGQISVSNNYSWITSDVTVRAGSIFEPTNLSRPLEGQASYVLNTGLNWNNTNNVDVGVFYNRFGKRLAAAGGSGIPDIFEQPRNSLDASIGFPLLVGATAKVRAINLLDDEYRFEQSATGITQIQRLFTTGRTLSVGISWKY